MIIPIETLRALNKSSGNSLTDPSVASVTEENKTALVFGCSGEQGRAVIAGLLDVGYGPIYGVTSKMTYTSKMLSSYKHEHHLIGRVFLIEGDLREEKKVEQLLTETEAKYIFMVTATEFPVDLPIIHNFRGAEEEEYDTIRRFFDTLVEVYLKDGRERHIIMSSFENIKALNYQSNTELPIVEALNDGSVVAHFSGKGRGAEYGLERLEGIDDLAITILSLPFLYSNFLSAMAPLPNEGRNEWTISACLGNNYIDMFDVADLAHVVPLVFGADGLYDNAKIKLSAGKISLDEVSQIFSNVFGKDVVYNPLTYQEMIRIGKGVPAIKAIAQECQYFASSMASYDDKFTRSLIFPHRPKSFRNWLWTNYRNDVFQSLGLSVHKEPIHSVCVFDATSLEGQSVIRALLQDSSHMYKIRAVASDIVGPAALELKGQDPERVSLFKLDHMKDSHHTLKAAVTDIDGVFLVTDFSKKKNTKQDKVHDVEEEMWALDVIDACHDVGTVKHIVCCTMEGLSEMSHELDKKNLEAFPLRKRLEDVKIDDADSVAFQDNIFDHKKMIASYSKLENISCTYLILPLYSDYFFDMLSVAVNDNGKINNKVAIELASNIPEGIEKDTTLVCMSIDDLGYAVANVFKHYESFAGHEIALATDFVTLEQVSELMEKMLFDEKDGMLFVREPPHTKGVESENKTRTVDLGNIFDYLSHSDAVRYRHSIARTLDLCPNASTLQDWMEKNRFNPAFREKLGLR